MQHKEDEAKKVKKTQRKHGVTNSKDGMINSKEKTFYGKNI